LCLSNVVDSFELNDDYSIIEAKVPIDYIGKTVREVGFRREFNLLVLTIIKKIEVKSILGKTKTENQIQGVASADNKLETDDIWFYMALTKIYKSF
jgi:trk system potassium uptake protein TrkA